MSKIYLYRAWLGVFICFFAHAETHASSIQKRALSELAEQAVLVFEGKVTKVATKLSASGSSTYTLVTFSVKDVIKGDYQDNEVVLDFAGGSVESMQQHIDGLVYPKLDEAGIYFVESLDKKLVNPLLGWSQGHFKLKNNRVYSNSFKPVTGVQPFARKALPNDLSEGFANGVTLGKERDSAIDKKDFIDTIKLLAR